MVANQVRVDNDTRPFLLGGVAASKMNGVIQQDAGRSIALAAYTVLGAAMVAAGAIVDGTNTGNGTVTVLALAGGPMPLVGDYNLECTFAVTNGGVFKLEDPNGALVAENIALRVGAGLLTTVVAGGLSFIITDGSTDFADGDTFALAVAAVGKYVPLDPTGLDGSQIPKGIYSGPGITAAAIVAGDIADTPVLIGASCFVDENLVVLESSATLDDVLPSGDTIREALAKIGIFTEDTIEISGYENT